MSKVISNSETDNSVWANLNLALGQYVEFLDAVQVLDEVFIMAVNNAGECILLRVKPSDGTFSARATLESSTGTPLVTPANFVGMGRNFNNLVIGTNASFADRISYVDVTQPVTGNADWEAFNPGITLIDLWSVGDVIMIKNGSNLRYSSDLSAQNSTSFLAAGGDSVDNSNGSFAHADVNGFGWMINQAFGSASADIMVTSDEGITWNNNGGIGSANTHVDFQITENGIFAIEDGPSPTALRFWPVGSVSSNNGLAVNLASLGGVVQSIGYIKHENRAYVTMADGVTVKQYYQTMPLVADPAAWTEDIRTNAPDGALCIPDLYFNFQQPI